MANGPVLIALLALAGLAAATLLGLALAGFARRRSRSYLLLALATLLARVAVATAAMGGLLADPDHHLAEHVLDVLMAALVIGAVYTARSARRRARDPYAEPGEEGEVRADTRAGVEEPEVVDDD
jgi:Kef-type K+ transport system membrane component KefB